MRKNVSVLNTDIPHISLGYRFVSIIFCANLGKKIKLSKKNNYLQR